MFGGGALNAIHALLTTVQAVLAGPDGLVPEPLRVGIIPPTEAEVAGWAALRSGDEELVESGAKPMDATAARDFWLRTTSEPTVELNGITGGSPMLQKTVLPVEAHANLSMRLAPGQSSAVVAPILERLLRDALPEGAELDLALWSTGEPAWIDPEDAAVRLAQDAFESVLGVRPVLARSGGSIPVAAALSAKGIPAIVAGFTRPTAQLHSPNENLPSSALVEGIETIVATLSRFGQLPRSTSLG
jgi:acetylornithine deacetylase/succinyl-diaminopimelate desuccinylase-like protein